MFIYRDSYDDSESNEPGVAEIILSKQRNGPTGRVKLTYVQSYSCFYSLFATDDCDC